MARKPQPRRRRIRQSIIDLAIKSVSTVVSNPIFILCVAVALYFEKDATIFDKIVSKFELNTILKPAAIFLKSNKNKTLNFIAVSGSAFSAPARYQIFLLSIYGFLIFNVITNPKIIETILIGLVVCIFIKTNNIFVRIGTFALACALVGLELITIG